MEILTVAPTALSLVGLTGTILVKHRYCVLSFFERKVRIIDIDYYVHAISEYSIFPKNNCTKKKKVKTVVISLQRRRAALNEPR